MGNIISCKCKSMSVSYVCIINNSFANMLDWNELIYSCITSHKMGILIKDKYAWRIEFISDVKK
jgi:hypothetical protein